MRAAPSGLFLLCCFSVRGFSQTPAFDVASVKISQRTAGRDARGAILIEPGRLSGRNVTLKNLIAEAYHLQAYQVSGGPKWLDGDEFDIDARAGRAAARPELDAMLQALLAERFHLASHRETKEMRVYALTSDKSGAKLHLSTHPSGARVLGGPGNFHGDMRQFADLIAVQLSIPTVDDPTRPSFATSAPVPVVDQTGLEGIYDISVAVRPEVGGDAFTLWQRVLRDQLGLALESKRAAVELLAVDRAERVPAGN